jgi:hypothetical protein
LGSPFLLVGLVDAFDERVAVGVAIRGAGALHAERACRRDVTLRGELGAVVVTQHDPRRGLAVDGVEVLEAGERGAARGLERDDNVGGVTARRERRAQDGPAAAVDDRGEVAPAVLATPHRGQVGLPQFVRAGDVGRATLLLGMRTPASPGDLQTLSNRWISSCPTR